MRRRLFNFAAAASLVLCVATVVLWVRSLHIEDDIPYSVADRDGNVPTVYGMTCYAGEVFVTKETASPPLVGADASDRRYSRFRPQGRVRIDPVASRHHSAGRRGSVQYLAYTGESTKRALGFGSDAMRFLTVGGRGILQVLVIPLYVPCVLFALLPFVYLSIAASRRFRQYAHRCPSCSYDLTGNVSGVCPECGTPVADKSGAAA